MSTITVYGTFTVLNCCNCGLPFCFPEDFEKRRRDDHENFYCPSGHPNYFPYKSPVEIERDKAAKLAQQLEVQEHRTAEALRLAEINNRSLIATKGHLTRVHKRVAHGVCPVPNCKRTVSQLAAHMKTKHPDYAEK